MLQYNKSMQSQAFFWMRRLLLMCIGRCTKKGKQGNSAREKESLLLPFVRCRFIRERAHARCLLVEPHSFCALVELAARFAAAAWCLDPRSAFLCSIILPHQMRTLALALSSPTHLFRRTSDPLSLTQDDRNVFVAVPLPHTVVYRYWWAESGTPFLWQRSLFNPPPLLTIAVLAYRHIASSEVQSCCAHCHITINLIRRNTAAGALRTCPLTRLYNDFICQSVDQPQTSSARAARRSLAVADHAPIS